MVLTTKITKPTKGGRGNQTKRGGYADSLDFLFC